MERRPGYPQSISIDGVLLELGERFRLEYEGEAALGWSSIPVGIHRLTHIYMNANRGIYLAGHRCERPHQHGANWGQYLTTMRDEGYRFRKLGSPKGGK